MWLQVQRLVAQWWREYKMQLEALADADAQNGVPGISHVPTGGQAAPPLQASGGAVLGNLQPGCKGTRVVASSRTSRKGKLEPEEFAAMSVQMWQQVGARAWQDGVTNDEARALFHVWDETSNSRCQ
jgi:hypothetical protein